jgi:hypothetical protein
MKTKYKKSIDERRTAGNIRYEESMRIYIFSMDSIHPSSQENKYMR